MTKEEFKLLRKKLGKTQTLLSEILGISLKTIHSYEQGWRVIPTHIERHLFYLLINQRGRNNGLTPCWEKKLCEVKEKCPAWEFQSGHLCWFICGTLCDCAQGSCHKEKLEICKECEILSSLLRDSENVNIP